MYKRCIIKEKLYKLQSISQQYNLTMVIIPETALKILVL